MLSNGLRRVLTLRSFHSSKDALGRPIRDKFYPNPSIFLLSQRLIHATPVKSSVAVKAEEISKLLSDATIDPDDERMIDKLIRYKEKHGDCHVPGGTSAFSRAERERLGVSDDFAAWVRKQREQYQKSPPKVNKKGKIDEARHIRILILESMGFMWSERESQWQRAFNRLERYQDEHGDLEVDKHKDQQLWTWVDQQRKSYQKGKLSEARFSLLKELKFVFDLQEAAWWSNYERLCSYKDEHGDTRVPTHSEEDPTLGTWVARQRRLFHTDQLSEERIDALEKIDFSWNVYEEAWDQFYNQLCEFREEHGHTRVPRSEGSLWHWVDRQRRHLRDKAREVQTTEENLGKIEALDMMGFDWSEDDNERAKRLRDLTFNIAVHDERWMENFDKLCSFKERFGHFAIPSHMPEYQELSNWVRHQRFLYKRDKLQEERVTIMDGIDFAWTAQVARWDIMYEKLVRFHTKHGHTRVPTRNQELYRWTNQQRKALRKSTENDEEARKNKTDRRMMALEKLLDK